MRRVCEFLGGYRDGLLVVTFLPDAQHAGDGLEKGDGNFPGRILRLGAESTFSRSSRG